MNIDKSLGDSYKHLLCDKCKDRIVYETKKLSKIDLLFPRRIIKRFKNVLCQRCFNLLIQEMQNRGKK